MQETRMRYTKETGGVKDEQHAEDRRGRCPQERDRGRGERQGLLRVQGSCHPEEGKVKKSGQSSATQGDCAALMRLGPLAHVAVLLVDHVLDEIWFSRTMSSSSSSSW